MVIKEIAYNHLERNLFTFSNNHLKQKFENLQDSCSFNFRFIISNLRVFDFKRLYVLLRRLDPTKNSTKYK